MKEGPAASRELAKSRQRASDRSYLERVDPTFRDLSPDRGTLDEEAVAVALRDDLDHGLAALVGALDQVITVDNTLAHLAGALGRRVWIVLPRAVDWRWGRAGDASVWYPAAKLWRQSAPGDWTAIAAGIASTLRAGTA